MEQQRGFTIAGLGEIAIRCADMKAMVGFYRDIIGLPLLSGGEGADITFLKIAEGFGGHTTVLALFKHTAGRADLHATSDRPPQTGAESSLHHIALSLPFGEQQAVIDWYEKKEIGFQVQIFGWVGWRGIFAADPEGNTVELVAFDRSLLDESPAS